MPSINKNDRAADRATHGGKGDQHRPDGLKKYREAPIWKKMGTKFNKSPQQEFDFHFEKP